VINHEPPSVLAATTSPARAQGEARARVWREVGRPQRQRREDGRVRGKQTRRGDALFVHCTA
jgi:hypothetical protein